MESEQKVLVFKYICNFIKDLNESFGEGQKSLRLYAHLVERTGIMHEEPIRKHIRLFFDFLHENRDAVVEKDPKAFKTWRLDYSEKVGVDMKDVLERADRQETEAIFKHLLAILAVLDPSSSAKDVLKKELEEKKRAGEDGNEEVFLKNIIDKVSSQVDPNTENPMELMTKMMSSGVVSEIVEDMNSSFSKGNLDMGKMIQTMQSLIGGLGQMMPPRHNLPSMD
jgi:hypothetical protein